VDFGSDLPGACAAEPPGPIDGLSRGDGSRSALFLTHGHCDHSGRLGEVLPGVPVYMGKTAKALHRNYAARVRSADLAAIDDIREFRELDGIEIGDILVTPLMVDHSAFDSYMFLVDACGRRILHTGDFRTHGFRGGRTFGMLAHRAKGVDWIVCENTALSREGAPAMTERELQSRARVLMKRSKHVFALCASTNIDRIAAFYHANPAGRLFVCDEYQKAQLEAVRAGHASRSRLYDFSRVYSYAPNLDAPMERNGFCMLIKQDSASKKPLGMYKGRSAIIYSMWAGYLNGAQKSEALDELLRGYEFEALHTSGHASPADLAELYRTVRPKSGLIPIHGETPERFAQLIPDGKLTVLGDGETLEI
jgi:ribonuclease J